MINSTQIIPCICLNVIDNLNISPTGIYITVRIDLDRYFPFDRLENIIILIDPNRLVIDIFRIPPKDFPLDDINPIMPHIPFG